MPCTVCQHPQHQEIDQALLHRTATLAQLSEQHGLSTSALHRHKQHLLAKTALAQTRFQAILREGYLFMLYRFLEMVFGVARTAEAEGDSRQVLQAARQAAGIIKFMAKLDASLTPETVHRLLASPQWAEQGSLLPADPEFVAGSYQTLAASLIASCPEPGSEDLAQLQIQLANLSRSLGSPGCQPPAAKREKGGKKPGKTAPDDDILMNYQSVIDFMKNAGINPLAGSGHCLQTEADRLSVARNSKGALPVYEPCYIDDAEQKRLDELEEKIALLDRDPLTQNLSSAEEDVIFEHLYNCGPLPLGKPVSAYLFEQGFLTERFKKNGQGLSISRS